MSARTIHPGVHAEGNVQDSDQAQIDALIAAFFAAFDNRKGRAPDPERLARMFAEQAVVTMHQASGCLLYTPQEFIAPRVALLKSGELVEFHEWEDSATTQVLGSLGVRTSRYAKSGVRNGDSFTGSGTKFFHIARMAGGWQIVALSWIDDA